MWRSACCLDRCRSNHFDGNYHWCRFSYWECVKIIDTSSYLSRSLWYTTVRSCLYSDIKIIYFSHLAQSHRLCCLSQWFPAHSQAVMVFRCPLCTVYSHPPPSSPSCLSPICSLLDEKPFWWLIGEWCCYLESHSISAEGGEESARRERKAQEE